MEEIKKLLGDVLYGQIVEKLGDKQLFMYDKGQSVVIDDGKMIPKYRLDEVLEQKKGLQTLLEQGEKDLKSLKKLAEGNTGLTEQIETLQKQGKDAKVAFEQAELQIKKSFALKEALMNAGVVDSEARDLLSLKFDASKIELDDKGKVKGFDDMVKPIKESKVFSGMFGETKLAGQQHGQGGSPEAGSELSTLLDAAVKGGDLLQQIAIKRQIAEKQRLAQTS